MNILEEAVNPKQDEIDAVKFLVENNYMPGFSRLSFVSKASILAHAVVWIIGRRDEHVEVLFPARNDFAVLTLGNDEIASVVADVLAPHMAPEAE